MYIRPALVGALVPSRAGSSRSRRCPASSKISPPIWSVAQGTVPATPTRSACRATEAAGDGRWWATPPLGHQPTQAPSHRFIKALFNIRCGLENRCGPGLAPTDQVLYPGMRSYTRGVVAFRSVSDPGRMESPTRRLPTAEKNEEAVDCPCILMLVSVQNRLSRSKVSRLDSCRTRNGEETSTVCTRGRTAGQTGRGSNVMKPPRLRHVKKMGRSSTGGTGSQLLLGFRAGIRTLATGDGYSVQQWAVRKGSSCDSLDKVYVRLDIVSRDVVTLTSLLVRRVRRL